MFSKLLGKAKRKRRSDGGIELDESIDLDSGIIYIDDTIDPTKVVSTSEVFDQVEKKNDEPQAAEPKKQPTIGGCGAKIFILDLRPFFKAIGAKKGERAADSFVRFAENWLIRCIAPDGIYEFVGGDTFFFRLNMPNGQAAQQAVRIVNEIGTQYLRDAYKPEEMLADILGAVDGGKDGAIDAKRTRDSLAAWRALDREARRDAFANAWHTSDTSDDPTTYMVPIERGRKASERVQRGPERRKANKPIDGQDRRLRKRGRRATDKAGSKTAVWS